MNTDKLTVWPFSGSTTRSAKADLSLYIRRGFLACGAVLGVCYAILLPPLQAPDEFAHFYRAYNVADGYCIAPELSPIPHSLQEMAIAFQPSLETHRRIGAQDLARFMRMPLNDALRDPSWNHAINVYNCLPYAPAAVGIFAGRLGGASPAAILYLGRLANLAAYLALVYLALRALPDFQLPLFLLALMPMTLHQAGSASWDAVSFSSAFFFCAYIVKLAWDDRITTLHAKHYGILAAAVIIASLCRTNLCLAMLMLCVPAYKFGDRRRKWAALGGYALLGVVVIAVWSYLNRANMARWVAHIEQWKQIHFYVNTALLSHHPWLFAKLLVRTWIGGIPYWTPQFIGILGWLAVHLPVWALCAYYAVLALATLTGVETIRMKPWHRLVFAGAFVVATTAMLAALWCANDVYARGDLYGDGQVPDVQGRYFIPFALPLLLAFSSLRFRINRKWLAAIAAMTVLTVNGLALRGIYGAYYLTGVPAVDYEHNLVRRSGNGPDDGKVFVVQSGKKRWIQHASWITKHGYQWPQDVLVISPEQLAAIPEGEAIGEP